MAQEAARATASIYQLKVTLGGLQPPIWRTLQVRSDTVLADLHHVLQQAFHWWDDHLHQFTAYGVEYGVENPDWPQELRDERAYGLAEVLPKVGMRMTYEYDFGDGWRHRIVLEKILKPDPAVKYPRCIRGKRNTPPEDCGGVFGYMSLLAALADPDHEQHAEYVEWVDGSFDPEAFSLDEINARLGAF